MDIDNSNNHNHPSNSDMVDVESVGGAGQPMAEIVSPSTQMSYDDITRLLAVTTMRADICVQRTQSRKCGYIIRPEVRFPQMSGRLAQYLESLGVTPREVYAKPEEINRVLSITKGMDEFVSNQSGLNLVRNLNGVLKQPKDHQGVLNALKLIENTIERMN